MQLYHFLSIISEKNNFQNIYKKVLILYSYPLYNIDKLKRESRKFKEDKEMKNVVALNSIKNATIRNYEDKSIWYAVLVDEDDNDYGTGSFDFIKACEMLESLNGEKIAIVDDNDGYCLDIIEKDDIAEFM